MHTTCLFVLLVIITYTTATVIRSPIQRIESKRERLVRQGKYADYVKLRNELRAKSGSGAQIVYDYDDILYVGNLTIGTPPQNFRIILDTGSADLWVPDFLCGGTANCSKACTTIPTFLCNALCHHECCPGDQKAPKADPCDGKNKFTPSLSTTFQHNGQGWSIEYGTGSASGVLGVDKVCFGESGICSMNQKFGLATNLADFFSDEPLDGILGLAFASISVSNTVPPFIAISSQLDNPFFTVWMTHEGPTENVNGGLFTYGALDPVHCAPNPTWVPLSSSTYYQFTITGSKVGTHNAGGRAEVISDTGTSLIGGPTSAIGTIARNLGGQYHSDEELWYIACDAQGDDVIFTIAGVDYAVSYTNYIVPSGNPGTCILGFFAFQFGGFGPSWILGDPWIRQYCNIYDVGQHRIGFARALM